MTASGPGTKLQLLEEFGWERCYHREGSDFHFNVKDGGRRWNGFQDAVPKREGFDRDLFDRIAAEQEEGDREFWWADRLIEPLHELGYTSSHGRPRLWSCGRSGGYLHSNDLESDMVGMIEMGKWLTKEMEGYRSYASGKYAAEFALELYDERKLEQLASPRPTRIEA